MTYDGGIVAATVFEQGWAKLRLSESDRLVLAHLMETSTVFFSQSHVAKCLHAADDAHGYRAMGQEYSATAERPDVNESLSLWSDRLDLIPHAAHLGPVGALLVDWQRIAADITWSVLEGLAKRFSQERVLPFRAASSVQVNQYAPAPLSRECLQDRHEDGHIVTLVHGTKPGLELFIDGEPMPVTTAEDELIVMPGSVLTMLTGGSVSPMYHQVRNLGIADRRSVMYFVNPEMREPIVPWVGSRHDLREAVRSRPNAFGLPDVPSL
jgi:isopenicillin N synthase-like dioxygenase